MLNFVQKAAEATSLAVASGIKKVETNTKNVTKKLPFMTPVPRDESRTLGSVYVPEELLGQDGLSTHLYANDKDSKDERPMYETPLDYKYVYGGKDPTFSVRRPVPPPGYASMGDIMEGTEKPRPEIAWCVRENHTYTREDDPPVTLDLPSYGGQEVPRIFAYDVTGKKTVSGVDLGLNPELCLHFRVVTGDAHHKEKGLFRVLKNA